jgi:hypothetical protein
MMSERQFPPNVKDSRLCGAGTSAGRWRIICAQTRAMAMDDVNPWGEKQEVLALLGATLLVVQMAERTLKSCMALALPRGGINTAESLERQTAEEAKKTLGYFLGQLRHRVTVQPEFDAVLAEFLDRRNRLVHHLNSVEGLNLRTPEGRAVADIFIRTTATIAVRIINVFMGLMRAWAEQVAIEIEVNSDAFEEIDSIYKPMVSELFTEKPDPA